METSVMSKAPATLLIFMICYGDVAIVNGRVIGKMKTNEVEAEIQYRRARCG
jgi:hypothetical protein